MTAACSPIAEGSHVIRSGQLLFLVNFYSPTNAAPESVKLVLNGVSISMSLHLGSAGRGTYKYNTAFGTSCRSYHFEIHDAAGATWRYPASGELRTFGDVNCAEDYQPPAHCVGDFDNSGTIGQEDLFAFLRAWFAGDIGADVNNSGTVTAQDLFDFLHAWFAGCP